WVLARRRALQPCLERRTAFRRRLVEPAEATLGIGRGRGSVKPVAMALRIERLQPHVTPLHRLACRPRARRPSSEFAHRHILKPVGRELSHCGTTRSRTSLAAGMRQKERKASRKKGRPEGGRPSLRIGLGGGKPVRSVKIGPDSLIGG